MRDVTLYFIRTHIGDLIVSDDGKLRRVLLNSEQCTIDAGQEKPHERALELLGNVKSDKDWGDWSSVPFNDLYAWATGEKTFDILATTSAAF